MQVLALKEFIVYLRRQCNQVNCIQCHTCHHAYKGNKGDVLQGLKITYGFLKKMKLFCRRILAQVYFVI